MTSYNYLFYTKVHDFAIPPAYTEGYDLSALPLGWTAVGAPTFGVDGMTTLTGSSYIYKTFSLGDLNFESGFLIDIKIVSTGISPGITKIIEVIDDHQNLVSVYADLVNEEIWISDVSDIPITDFRPTFKDGAVIRLSVYKNSNNQLIARLFTSSATLSEPTPLLQQTVLLSNTSPTCGIKVGSIETGDGDVKVNYLKMLCNYNPDDYYPFPRIVSVSPSKFSLNGGEKIKITLEDSINMVLGSDVFDNLDNIRDESTGTGVISVLSQKLILESTSGVGQAIARFLNSFGGDIPGGAGISFNVSVDASIITSPPPAEVILFGVEFGINGDITALELASNSADKTFFRIIQGSTLTTNITMVTQNTHSVSIIRSGYKLIFMLNGSSIYERPLGSGVGRLRLYTDSPSTPITTEISNFNVRPVISIGSNVVS